MNLYSFTRQTYLFACKKMFLVVFDLSLHIFSTFKHNIFLIENVADDALIQCPRYVVQLKGKHKECTCTCKYINIHM